MQLTAEQKQRIDDCTLLVCLAEHLRLNRLSKPRLGRITKEDAAAALERIAKALEP